MNQPSVEASKLRSDALTLGRQVEQYALAQLSQQQANQSDTVRIALMAMAVRMYRSHQAVCKLVTSNLNDGAATVLRSLLEQYFVLVAVVAYSQNLSVAAAQAEGERLKALKGLKAMRPDERGSQVTDSALDEAISGITATHGYSVYDWAQKADCVGIYHTIWRRLCTYSHGGVHAIEEYVKMTPDGVVHGINSIVEHTPSIDFVITSSGLLLEAVEAIDKAPGTDLQSHRLGDLQINYSSLRERYGALCGIDADAPA